MVISPIIQLPTAGSTRSGDRQTRSSVAVPTHAFRPPARSPYRPSLNPPFAAGVPAMVMVVLDALGRGHTLFLPRLRLWAQPKMCARADMSCFFDALPSLSSLRRKSAANPAFCQREKDLSPFFR